MAVAAPTAVDFCCRIRSRMRPHHQRSGGREHRRRERQGGDAVGRQGAAGVEAEPAEPEQTGAEERERHVVRQQARGRIVLALADADRSHQRGNAGVHVHDRAAREVERAHVGEPAAAPHPVAERAVDEHGPQADEHEVGREPHALDDGARDERGGDDGERSLEAHEEQVRDRPLFGEPDTVQEHPRRVANPVIARPEGQRITDGRPQHTHESE